ncbi:MAG: type II secretion system F family protein [Candidatus Blackburnbacteria bacterium]|nr:type II secretion system F family protein [Candidatus Blackburnbacteria bacterium]
MNRFVYKARDKSGKLVKGQVEAQDIREAAKLLREQGYVVISLSPKHASLLDLWRRVGQRVTLYDIALFTRQFSIMITAGLPITDALLIIKTQSRPALRPIVDSLLSDIEGGSSLSAALEKHPKIFSPVYIALVKAGEGGGVLDNILARLADNLEAQREFQSKVKGALIYPVIVVVGMIAVAVVMMVFVIPKMLSLFADFNAELPMPTKALMAISSFSEKYWWIVGGVIGGIVWVLMLLAKTPKGRQKVDELKLKLPILGPLQRQVILTELTRTLGLLVGAGVSLLEGLRIVSGVVGNTVVNAAITRSSTQVEQGFSLAYAFSQEAEVFPPMLYQMLAVGEETGKLDESLIKVSHVFEQESEHLVKGLTAAVEPLVMIILGIGVGFLVIAVILPIYNLTGQF